MAPSWVTVIEVFRVFTNGLWFLRSAYVTVYTCVHSIGDQSAVRGEAVGMFIPRPLGAPLTVPLQQ